MKETRTSPSSPIIRRGQIRPRSSDNNRRTSPGFNYIKVAAKKVAGLFAKLLFWQRKATSREDKPNNKQGQTGGISDNSSGSNSKTSPISNYSNSYGSSMASSGLVGTINLSIQDIYKATGNFSPENIIGEGGFGTVYKGKLSDGTLVAIKRAKKGLYSLAEFKNEVLTLSKIEHLNLVRLFGYLEHGDEQIILVEYVGNGTLREHLDGMRGNGLEIAERLDIAIDVAHAVTYLHMYTDPPIIHRDIKALNILLTEKLRAKVADFGFARLAAVDPGATHISTQVKGTAGYLDPEYLSTYQLTDKSDVYSFGVLLVEMMTGRQPIESKRNASERVTIRWAMKKLKEGDAVLAMDPRVRRNAASVMVVEKVLRVARRCLAPSRQTRPSMKKCAEVLWGIRKDFNEKILLNSAATSYYSANVLEREGTNNRNNLFRTEDRDDSYGFRSV